MEKGMELKMVNVEELHFSEYRSARKRRLSALADSFDPIRAGVITVSHRDGKNYIIDGGRRVFAMKQKQIPVCPAMILNGLTIEQEADYFRKQGENISNLTQYEKYHAGIYALDPIDVEIEAIITRNQFTFTRTTKDGQRISAVGAIKRIYTQSSSEILEKTLAIFRNVWDGNKNALRKDYFYGVAELVKYHSDVDFIDRLKDIPFDEIVKRSESLFANNTRSHAFYLAIVELYNEKVASITKQELN